VTRVELVVWTLDTVIPEDGEKLTALAPVRLEPLIVRVNDVPQLPSVGEIHKMVGGGVWLWLWVTVNARAFDVPPGVVTDT